METKLFRPSIRAGARLPHPELIRVKTVISKVGGFQREAIEEVEESRGREGGLAPRSHAAFAFALARFAARFFFLLLLSHFISDKVLPPIAMTTNAYTK